MRNNGTMHTYDHINARASSITTIEDNAVSVINEAIQTAIAPYTSRIKVQNESISHLHNQRNSLDCILRRRILPRTMVRDMASLLAIQHTHHDCVDSNPNQHCQS